MTTASPTRRAPAGAVELAGMAALARLALRQSRWFWGSWIIALAAVVAATGRAYETIIPDPASAATTIAGLANNPTMRAMLGPPYDLATPGPFTAWRVGTFVAATAGVVAILGIVRATRAQEEDGRTELLRAGVVGRHAPLAAGLLVCLGACVVLGVLIALSMVGTGNPLPGSVALGAGIGLVGAGFVGLGAVTSQITASARAARGMAMGALGAAYLVRAVADGVADDNPLRRLQWISPVEWMALSRPYAGERWWVLLLPLVLTAALVVLAIDLERRRDHGAGLRSVRGGPAHAAARFDTVSALAARLDRGSVIGWAVGVLITCLAIGSLSGGLQDMFKDTPQLEEIFRRMGGGSEQLTDAFFTAMLGIVAVVLAVLGVQLLARLGREEERGHAELLLATSVPRTRLALSHLVPALVVPTVLLVVGGAVLAVPEALSQSSPSLPLQIAGGALVLAPGCWLVVGLLMALYGWVPQLAWLAWVAIGWSLIMVWVGAVLGLPDWLVRLTPWASLPKVPSEPMSWTPVLIVSLAAVALCLLGLAGYRRRDITTP